MDISNFRRRFVSCCAISCENLCTPAKLAFKNPSGFVSREDEIPTEKFVTFLTLPQARLNLSGPVSIQKSSGKVREISVSLYILLKRETLMFNQSQH